METSSRANRRNYRNAGITRRRQGKEEPAEECAARRCRDNLLKNRFTPVIESRALLMNQQKMEDELFQSLGYLGRLYNFSPLPRKEYPFPTNIQMAVKHAGYKVRKLVPEASLIAVEEKRHYFVITKVELDCSGCLLYVPFEPLCAMVARGEMQSAELLMCVYSYLLKKVKMDCYVDKDSYVAGQYDFIEELAEDSGDEDTYWEYIYSLSDAEHFGKAVYNEINKPYHLKEWRQRLDQFLPDNDRDCEILAIAKRAYGLYQQYPKAHFHQHIPGASSIKRDDDDDTPIATPYHYFSFVWSTKDDVFSSLVDNINMEFDGYPDTLCPQRIQRFNCPQYHIDIDINFEIEIHALINDLYHL